MRFYLTSCRFVIKPLDTLVLPAYKGVLLRGGLGTVFRDLVCIKRDRDCGTCLISNTCAYFKIFETPVPKGAAMMRKYPYAPHPFVITPPLILKTEFAPFDEHAASAGAPRSTRINANPDSRAPLHARVRLRASFIFPAIGTRGQTLCPRP